MASAETALDGDESGERYALTSGGRRSVVSSVLEFPEYLESRTHQRTAIASVYGALVRREGPLRWGDLREYFIPAGVDTPKRGQFMRADKWWSDIGKEQLRSLPGVSASGEREAFRFDGLTEGEVSSLGLEDDETRPLEAFRNDPRVRAVRHLNDQYGTESDEKDDLLILWDEVATQSPITTEEMERDYRLPDPDQYGDALSELPHIQRETSRFDPAEFEVETYADVLAAEERRSKPPETTWGFVPPGE